MVSGSDDFTLYLWQPEEEKKPLTRMTGHQQLINDVQFSPDTRTIASASFDKSVKLWDGKTGKYVYIVLNSRLDKRSIVLRGFLAFYPLIL